MGCKVSEVGIMSEQIVNQLRESIKQRKQHKILVDMFKLRVEEYFLDEHNIPVRVLFYGDSFGVEREINIKTVFSTPKITIQVIYDFCNQFELDFKYTTCNGDRYIFEFEDKKMTSAFVEPSMM